MASVTITVTSGMPDGAITGTPSLPTGGVSDPAITGVPVSVDTIDSVPASTNGLSTSEGDGDMRTQVMPGGTMEDSGSITNDAVDPLPHIMPGSGKPQTNPLLSAQENDTTGVPHPPGTATSPSSSIPSRNPMASPMIKRHWWRV